MVSQLLFIKNMLDHSKVFLFVFFWFFKSAGELSTDIIFINKSTLGLEQSIILAMH